MNPPTCTYHNVYTVPGETTTSGHCRLERTQRKKAVTTGASSIQGIFQNQLFFTFLPMAPGNCWAFFLFLFVSKAIYVYEENFCRCVAHPSSYLHGTVLRQAFLVFPQTAYRGTSASHSLCALERCIWFLLE